MIQKEPKKTQEFVIAVALSSQLVFSVLVGLYIGKYLGEKYDWEPFASLTGAMLGFTVGTISFIRLHQITKK